MAVEGRQHRVVRAAACLGAAACVAGVLLVAGAQMRRGEEPLDGVAAGVAWAIDAAGTLHGAGERSFSALRLPLAALVAAGLGLAWARGRNVPDPVRLVAVLTLGWTGQTFLREGRLGLGAAFYAAAAAAYLLRRSAAARIDAPLPAALERIAYPALGLSFLALSLTRIDLYPPLSFDEMAYWIATRMQVGALPRGPLDLPDVLAPPYAFERFRSQAVPFFLQAAAASVHRGDILALRLASVAAGVATLAVAAAGVRRHLGPRLALGATALCSMSPLFLAYTRTGTYLPFTVLHGAACLWLTLRFCERRDAVSAAALGALLGLSLYFYQLSWFVPLLAAAALLAAHPRWLVTARGAALSLAVGAAAVVVVLPGVGLLGEGLRDVWGQTFDGRAVFLQRERESVSLTHPDAAWDRYVEAARVFAPPRVRPDGSLSLELRGSEDHVRHALPALLADGWQIDSRRPAASAWTLDLVDQASMLLFAPSQESARYWVAAPLVGSVAAPLLLLGLLEAARRRREPAVRVLFVWSLVAALLPGTLGSPLPRRALLVLPALPALAALPLVAAFPGTGARGPRRWSAAILAAVVLAVAVDGVHSYFAGWYWAAPPGATGVEPGVSREREDAKLDLLARVRALPADEAILVGPIFPHVDFFLARTYEEARPGEGQRVFVRRGADAPENLLRASCAMRTPFTWIALDTPEQRAHFDRLRRDFVVEVESRGPLQSVRIVSRKRGACAPDARPADGA